MGSDDGTARHEPRRTVHLRAEMNPPDYRYLWAYVDDDGALHIDGQDLGPGTAMVSSDGEYEWFETIRAAHIGQLITLLGGEPGSDILDLLERRYTDRGSYDLEAILRGSDIPVERFVYGG